MHCFKFFCSHSTGKKVSLNKYYKHFSRIIHFNDLIIQQSPLSSYEVTTQFLWSFKFNYRCRSKYFLTSSSMYNRYIYIYVYIILYQFMWQRMVCKNYWHTFAIFIINEFKSKFSYLLDKEYTFDIWEVHLHKSNHEN